MNVIKYSLSIDRSSISYANQWVPGVYTVYRSHQSRPTENVNMSMRVSKYRSSQLYARQKKVKVKVYLRS